jgi:hypothetical protein
MLAVEAEDVLDELFSAVDGADVRIGKVLELAERLKSAGDPRLRPVAAVLRRWDNPARGERERSWQAKAAFLIVWAALERRADGVRSLLAELERLRGEAAAAVKRALEGRGGWDEFYAYVKKAAEVEEAVLKTADDLARELNALAARLRAAAEKKGAKGLEEVAEWVEVDAAEAKRLAEAAEDELLKFSGASYGTRAAAYLMAAVNDNAVGLTALRAFATGDLATLVAYAPITAYSKLGARARGVRRTPLRGLPPEERLAVELGRLLRYAKEHEELRPLAEAFEGGDVVVKKSGRGKYVIRAGGRSATLKLTGRGGAHLSGELVRPLEERRLEEAKEAVLKYEEMKRRGRAPLPSRGAQDGWLLSDVHVNERYGVITMGTASLEQVVAFLSAFGVRAGEIHWGRGERGKKPVKIDVKGFNVTGKGLRPMYHVELSGEYFKEVWRRLSAARAMSEEEKRAFIDFVARRLEGPRREGLREGLEKWVGEWLAKAPGLKGHRVFHILVDVLRELAQSGGDAERRGAARRRAVEALLYAVLGDGSVSRKWVVLAVGGGRGGGVPAEVKADLYCALLRELGYRPRVAKADGAVHVRLHSGDVKKFAKEALPHLVPLELLLEAVKSDGQIYAKVQKLVEVARAERVRARVEEFTTEGKRPRARLVVEADGERAEYRVYFDSTVELSSNAADRWEVERRAAVLRAVGVRATLGRQGKMWYLSAWANALAADSVHEEVRKAVLEFLRRCREAGALKEDTYRRLAAKLENGLPERVRFGISVKRGAAIYVEARPKDPQSLKKAVEFLKSLGMRDACKGDWCAVHFTVREPRGGRYGHVYITADGLRYIGWLASRGDWRAQQLKKALLKRAEARGEEVRRLLERRFREGERYGSVKLPVEREVEVEGRRVKVRVEEVEARREVGKVKEHFVVRVRAEVDGGGRRIAVEKELKFYKKRYGIVRGYVIIRASAEGGREADYIRTAAVLKALGVEKWSRPKKDCMCFSRAALDALAALEPVARVLLA